MSRVFYVTGGRHRKNAKPDQEWTSFDQAQVMRINVDTGEVEAKATYDSPPDHRPDDPEANIVFKAGVIAGDSLHVCTQTEIVTFALPDLAQVSCVSHPWFNDLHHVTVDDGGNFLVAVTGLDLVLEVTPGGDVVAEWPVPGGDTWDRFDRDADYRKVVTTKPHRVHPNFVFRHRGDLWVTRFVQKDAIRLTGEPGGIEAQDEKLHDGEVRGDRLYVTVVDGHLAVADLATGRTLEVYDLNAITDADRILGWCRGLYLLDDRRAVVGFSRMRPSRFRENVQWMKYRLGLRENAGRMGTRLVCYDLERRSQEWVFDLEAHEMHAVFSVLRA